MSLSAFFYFVLLIVLAVNPSSLILTGAFLFADRSREERKKNLMRVVLFVSTVFVLCILTSHAVLTFFGVRQATLMFVVGLIFVWQGYCMLCGRSSPFQMNVEQLQQTALRENPVVIPLSIPLCINPVTIAAMFAAHQMGARWLDKGLLSLGSVIIVVALAFLMFYSDKLFAKLGKLYLEFITRCLGFLLLIYAIDFLHTSLINFFPTWV